jgi:hypothetical protein
MGARKRVGIRLSYRPARLHRLAELVPWNRFLGSSHTPFYSRILDRYLNDDENGFSCTSDIFFVASPHHGEMALGYRVLH